MMSYRAGMELCVSYIECHIGDKITAKELADLTGYSLYHFCHVFSAYFDMPVAEYIRSSVLRQSASEVLRGKPITEVAFSSGYSTSAGFSKAFRKHFGMSASEYRRHFKKRSAQHMEPKFVEKETFSAVGYLIPPKDNKTVDTLESGAYWSGVDLKDYAKYHTDSSANGEIGAWMHPDGISGELSYFFGYISASDDVPEGLIRISVPAAEYAVFDVQPVTHDIHGGEKIALEIRKTWKYVFKEWLDQSKYAFDESKMCFEFYHGRDTQIFVPVTIKAELS